MDKFKFEAEDVNGNVLEFGSETNTPPDEATISRAFQEAEQSGLFSTKKQPRGERKFFDKGPLNRLDEIIISNAANDEMRIKYIADRFKSADVSTDVNGNITIDGQQINLHGFGMEDITQNAGYGLNLAGNIGGAIAGTMSGIGPIAGGGIGQGVGELARLGMGEIGGIEGNLMHAPKNVINEASYGATGEFLGMAGAKAFGASTSALANSKPAVMLSNAYKGMANKLQLANLYHSYMPSILKFITGVDERVVDAIPSLGGFQTVIKPQYLDPTNMYKLTNKMMVGGQAPNLSDDLLRVKILEQFSKIDSKLSKSGLSSRSYRELLKYTTGADDEMLDGVSKYGAKDLLNPANYSKERSVIIARNLEGVFDNAKDVVGKEMSEIEDSFIKNYSPVMGKRVPKTINLQAALDEAFGELKRTGMLSNQPPFKIVNGKPIKMRVEDVSADLKRVYNILRNEFQISEAQLKAYGNKERNKLLSKGGYSAETIEKMVEKKVSDLRKNKDLTKVSFDSMIKLRRALDSELNRMYKGSSASDNSLRIFSQFNNRLRNIIKDSIDDGAYAEAVRKYSSLKDAGDSLKFGDEKFTDTASRLINSGRVNDPLNYERLTSVLSAIEDAVPGQKGYADKIASDIERHNIGNRLVKIDPKSSIDSFQKMIDKDDIILGNTPGNSPYNKSENIEQNILEDADAVLANIGESFLLEAKRSKVGQHLNSGGANAFRASAVVGHLASATGGAAIGGVLGGPAGAALGGGLTTMASLSLTRPKIMAQMIAQAEKSQMIQRLHGMASTAIGNTQGAIRGGANALGASYKVGAGPGISSYLREQNS